MILQSGTDPIPSKYRASTADTNTNTDSQPMCFHVGKKQYLCTLSKIASACALLSIWQDQGSYKSSAEQSRGAKCAVQHAKGATFARTSLFFDETGENWQLMNAEVEQYRSHQHQR